MGTRAFKNLCKNLNPPFRGCSSFYLFYVSYSFFSKKYFFAYFLSGGEGRRDTLGWGKRQKKLIFMQSIFLYKV